MKLDSIERKIFIAASCDVFQFPVVGFAKTAFQVVAMNAYIGDSI
jgi:hypothetical protein